MLFRDWQRTPRAFGTSFFRKSLDSDGRKMHRVDGPYKIYYFSRMPMETQELTTPLATRHAIHGGIQRLPYYFTLRDALHQLTSYILCGGPC